MYYKLICILYALLCGQNFILVKSGCYRVTVRGIVTTTLMVTLVANPIPSAPLGLLRVSLRCSRGLLCCLHMSSPASARWSCEAVACLSHLIKLQCKTFTRI
jgi:hypothetical protein